MTEDIKKKPVGLFDYINSINTNKDFIMVDEKSYPPFMVNKALGYFQDTIAYAQLMNQNSGLSNKHQYQFLLAMVRPAKRYTKWPKKFKDDRVSVIKEHYSCNEERAIEILSLISDTEYEGIKKLTYKGGVDGR